MNTLQTGQFYGTTNVTTKHGGLTLTDTEYTHEYVDWHYHQNAYFTFILDGRVIEANKKETYHCTPGSLLFHNWEEAHYNIKPKGFTRGFHIELEQDWFKTYDINPGALQGSINLKHPQLKLLMYNVFKEAKLDGMAGTLAITALLIELFGKAIGSDAKITQQKPQWVTPLRDILHDAPLANWTLEELAKQLNIHPVHLSRDFSRYFNCGLGEYIRAIKIQQAMALLPCTNTSLTSIALQCGFADQSHFNRSFKALYHITPLAYRRLLA